MFINLSNHPFSQLTAKQLKLANKKYGRVIDMPFPAIDPRADINEIKKLVVRYRKKVLKLIKDETTGELFVIHLMGESTFLYQFAKEMEKLKLHCIASTTERILKINKDGSKTSAFKFVRFRSYF